MKDDDWVEAGLVGGALDSELSHDGQPVMDGESVPAPEYGDLLDTAWLTRGAGDAELDESVIDEGGVTLDLAEPGEDDEAGAVLEFDVGSLLTSLAPESTARGASRAERDALGGASDESIDDTFATRALHELLLPESSLPNASRPSSGLPGASIETDRGDEEVGDDERFPVFEPARITPVAGEDDAAIEVELD